MRNPRVSHTSLQNAQQGFSIVEVMVGIFIFSLGLVSIYALLVTSLKVNDYNANAIVGSNLAREQIELIRNIRDTNYKKNQVWNQANPAVDTYTSIDEIEPGKHYILSQDVATGNTQMDEISGFAEGKQELSKMTSYQVCLNADGYYGYCSTAGFDRKTPFYKYIFVEEAHDASGETLQNAYKITSKVIWYKRGYYDFSIETILADWRRI